MSSKRNEIPMYDKIFFSSYKELLDQARSMDDPVLSEVKVLLIDGYTKKVTLSAQDRKEMVDEIFDSITEGMIKKELSDDLSQSGLAGPVLSKRKDALISVMDRAVGLFADKYPDIICMEHNLAELESTPAPGTYASLNYKVHVDTAVALWILDDLKKSGKIAEASKYLPKVYDDLFTVDIPANFYDPCFDEDLVRSMVYVIRNRNMGDFDNKNSYRNAFADDVTAADRHKRMESDKRHNFDSIMKLVDSERAEAARKTYIDLHWDVLGRFLGGLEYFERLNSRVASEFASASAPAGMMSLSASPSMEKISEIIEKGVDNDMHKYMYIASLRDILDDPGSQLLKDRFDRREARVIAKPFKDFEIADPYEICFGFLYALENGDMEPWLFGSGYAILYKAASLLPWFKSDFEDMDDPALTYNYNGWLDNATDDLDSGIYNDKYARGRNAAQIVFNLTGAVLPRNSHPFAGVSDKLVSDGMDEHLVARLSYVSDVLFLSQFQSKKRQGGDLRYPVIIGIYILCFYCDVSV